MMRETRRFLSAPVVRACAVAIETLETRSLLSGGNIDASLGDHGLLLPKLPADADLTAVVVQSDGKIVVAGSVGQGAGAQTLVARFNFNGSLDKSFSGDGIFQKELSTGLDTAQALAIQSDGKIVVAGSAGGKIAVLRLTTGGNLDSSFSGDGVNTFGTNALGYDVAIQSNGRIVVAGAINGTMGAARLTTSGNLDSTFSGDGIVTVGQDTQFAHGLSISPNGQIILGGAQADPNTFGKAAIVKISSGGSVLSVTTIDYQGEFTSVNDVATGKNNEIYFTGSSDDDPEFYVERLPDFPNAFPDPAEPHPRPNHFPSFNDVGDSLFVQSDGKIVAAGIAFAQGEGDLVGIVRFNTDGTIDHSFGQNGLVLSQGTQSVASIDISPGPNGSFVAVGNGFNGTDIVPFLQRFDAGVTSTGNPFVSSGGVLTVNGTNASDLVRPTNFDDQPGITLNHQFAFTGNSITINTLGGNDDVSFSGAFGPASVTVNGGSGNDKIDLTDSTGGVVHAGSGNDSVTGSASNDALFGDDGNDLIDGRGGNDFLSGLAGNDSIKGGAGNDKLDGGTGADDFTGGSGTDTADYHFRTDNLSISLNNTADDGASGEHDNVRSDIENVSAGSGNDKIVGNFANNLLQGNAGNDTVFGGTGNDVLDGGSGHDQLFGQDGDDTFLAKDGTKDSLDGGNGADTASRDNSASVKDQVLNIESFI